MSAPIPTPSSIGDQAAVRAFEQFAREMEDDGLRVTYSLEEIAGDAREVSREVSRQDFTQRLEALVREGKAESRNIWSRLDDRGPETLLDLWIGPEAGDAVRWIGPNAGDAQEGREADRPDDLPF